jgi:SWI/SNF-related matrix-associated actin-dependent regulator of chromatin subfamily A-like protein 1
MPQMTAMPHQIVGANFLADRRVALLADHPRVGKTGAAILAADDILAARILVITTASGRPVWVRGFRDWSAFNLPTRAVYGELGSLDGDLRLIVSWSEIGKHAEALGKTKWDVLILDESHYAKSPDTKRTQAVYGTFRGASRGWGVCDAAARVWCLTGTPIPNAPNDLYPMLRALDGTRIEDVLKYEDFLHRYCIVKKKAISRYTKIDVVIGGRNLEELKARLDGFWLRRTQADVGIRPPTFEMLPLHLTASERKAVELAVPEGADILAAAETGETKSLDIALGTLRRLTGQIKAQKVAEVVKEEFEGGLDKIVLFCWHKDVMETLTRALAKYAVVRVDGGTSPTDREKAVQSFQSIDGARVCIGQIIAAGEAIDLSAAAELIFVESSFVPKDMKQAALRVTNHEQTRQTRVRVAALEGSIDEALQAIVIRKVSTNKEVMK